MVNDEATSNYLNQPLRSIMDAIADTARENGLSATSHPNGVVISGLVVQSFSVLQAVIDANGATSRTPPSKEHPMLKITTIIVPLNNNDGMELIGLAKSFVSGMISMFGGATVTPVTGHDPHCHFADGEPMYKVEVATDDTIHSKCRIYSKVLTLCEVAGQQGVMITWSDGSVQFAGDPTDTIGSPAGEPTDTIGSPAGEPPKATWSRQDKSRDQLLREGYNKRLAERDHANRPWNDDINRGQRHV